MSVAEVESSVEEDHHYVAILTSNGTRLLVNRTGECSFGLPSFVSHCDAVISIKYLSALSEHFGINKCLHIVEDVQCLEEQTDPRHDGSLVIVEVEDDGYCTLERFEHVEWKHLFRTDSLRCDCPYALGFLRGFLTQSGGVDMDRSLLPWCILGFYRKVYSSVDESLEGTSYVRTGCPQQVRFSYHSTVYRIPTATGYVFVKYVSEKSTEIPKTSVITGCLPEVSQSPMCINTKLNALFTVDFGMPLTDTCFAMNRPAAGYENVLSVSGLVLERWARTQQQSSSFLADLVAGGVPVRDEEWIWRGLLRVETFANRNLSSVPGISCQLQFGRSYLECVFRVWKDIPLPNTLVHGDLNESNMAQPEGPGTSFLFFDWELSYIGHPFLDLLDEKWNPVFRGVGKFLESWAKYAGISLKKAEELAIWTKPVGHLVTAIIELENPSLPEVFRKSSVSSGIQSFIEAACSQSEDLA